jgi:hypothetical protein
MRIREDSQAQIFQLGCVSTPLNFASQQLRAFKLAWALDQSGLIHGKEIAIVGAGLAGVTAGVVCLLRGAKRVSLYDRCHELLAAQRGAVHRYVHPLIFRWPEQGAEAQATDFPLLNWSQDTADGIRRKVVEEAEQLLETCYQARGVNRDAVDYSHRHDKLYQHRLGCDVRQIVPAGSQVLIVAEGQESTWVKARREYLPVGAIRNYQDRYDVVIVAVGFGLESASDGIPFRSYWHQDTLPQPTIRGTWPRRWLVSGTGDGGLIEAVRLRLFDPDQELLTDVLVGSPRKVKGFEVPPNWQHQVDALRTDLSATEDRIQGSYSDLEKRENQRDGISREIQLELDLLADTHPDVFRTLRSFFKARERTDTVVYLSGLQETPFSLNATLFQRFLVYLLRRDCGLRYRWGRALPLNTPVPDGPPRFVFDRGGNSAVRLPKETLEVDEVVIRHGTESALGALFGTAVVESAKKNRLREEFDKSLWTEPLDPAWSSKLKNPVPLTASS